MQIEYHNGTRLLAVIGDPIGHSLSPLLQNTMIRRLGREDLYLAVQVAKDGLPDFLQAARTLNFRGFNLTMPHKETVLPYLRDMTPQARRARSVNTVRLEDGQFFGHSTDGLGFRRSIRDLGLDFEGRTVAILGAGGAAKSIAMTAADSGAAAVHILNRTLSRAEALCAGEKVLFPHSLSQAERLLPQVDLLVNTTPVGMAGAGQTGDFSFLSRLREGAAAADCVYAPPVTPFLARAAALGHPTLGGLGMLVYQAVYAYAFFCGETFSEQTVTELGALLLNTAHAEGGLSPDPR